MCIIYSVAKSADMNAQPGWRSDSNRSNWNRTNRVKRATVPSSQPANWFLAIALKRWPHPSKARVSAKSGEIGFTEAHRKSGNVSIEKALCEEVRRPKESLQTMWELCCRSNVDRGLKYCDSKYRAAMILGKHFAKKRLHRAVRRNSSKENQKQSISTSHN